LPNFQIRIAHAGAGVKIDSTPIDAEASFSWLDIGYMELDGWTLPALAAVSLNNLQLS
jgi:hypothetical protein